MDDTTLQAQARALGDPTRHAIFRQIADAGRPVGIAELTEQFDVHHNAIRQHLAKLVAAGLLVEAKAPTNGRGRPRWAKHRTPTGGELDTLLGHNLQACEKLGPWHARP